VLALSLSISQVLGPGLARAQTTAASSGPSATAQPLPQSKYSSQQFQSLKDLIERTPLERMNLDFFKQVYRHEHAPDMLKLIFGTPELGAKSNRLANLRKFYDWHAQALYARDRFLTIENTNQGKSNGARSDLDATANILDFDVARGEWVVREGAVKALVEHQREIYRKDGLSPENVDVTLFNGDNWLPDWRDARLGYTEYSHQLLKNVWELKQRKGAYYAPGANREQTQDRALAEGRTVHIGWDYVAGRPSINGFPIDFNPGTGEIVWLEYDRARGEYKMGSAVIEMSTREEAGRGEAARYRGLEMLPPSERWRRALGNSIQNAHEFNQPHEPVSRNKYFIERVIDQGAGRFTHLADPNAAPELAPEAEAPTRYLEIHDADAARLPAERKLQWKQRYVQQAFGLAEGDPRVDEIRDILDRSAEIQLDKVKERQAYSERARHTAPNYYYAGEWAQAVANTAQPIEQLQQKAAAESRSVPAGELDRIRAQEAERLFVDKQRRIIVEAVVQVAAETFRREFPDPSRAQSSRFAEAGVTQKILFERGTELALLLDMVEAAPMSRRERDSFRKRVLDTIPEASRPLVAKLAEVAGLKLRLAGREGLERYTKASDGISDKRPTELLAEIAQEYKARFGESPAGAPVSEGLAGKALRDTIRQRLGPVDALRFELAWQQSKKALVARFGAKAYWREMAVQADGVMGTFLALGMIHAYQQNCIQQATWNEACLSGLASEMGNQVLYALPVVNSGLMIVEGLRAMGEGHYKEGAPSVALGVLSIPPVAQAAGLPAAAFVHVFLAIQIVSLGTTVTYSYAVQQMENDAVEQAFKALRVPGKQARPFAYPGRSDVLRGDTPTIPLLADVITGKDATGEEMAPAENWSDAERNRAAADRSAAAIQAELTQLGLRPETAEWKEKTREVTVRYGALLPYFQRTAKIYQVFGPRVEAKAEELGVVEDISLFRDCLEFREAEIEQRYAKSQPSSEQLSLWTEREKTRQADVAAVWSGCVETAIQEDKPLLTQVFDQYLDEWFGRQSYGYASAYNTPEMRSRLRSALMREYVVHRHLDLGYEEERQMGKALAAAKQMSAARVELMGKMLQTQQSLVTEVDERLRQDAGQTVSLTTVEPQLSIRPPPFAIRIGTPARVDFAVRGQYGAGETRPWVPTLEGEVVNISLAAPGNLIITPELEQELRGEPGRKPKRIVTIEERLHAALQNEGGDVLAKAETSVQYYDLVEWEGAIEVDVRAAGPATTDPTDRTQTSPYAYAPVKLSGAVSRYEQSSAPQSAAGSSTALFRELPEGRFTVRVEPRSTDQLHTAVEATVELTGVSTEPGENGQPVLILGDGRQTVTVVLPYVPAQPAEPAPAGPGPISQAPPPAEPRETVRLTDPNPAGIDTRLADECEALAGRARAALSRQDLSGATGILDDAARRGCDGSPSAGLLTATRRDVELEQDERLRAIRELQASVQDSLNSCDLESAFVQAQRLMEIDPENAWAAANIARLEQLAAAETNIRILLAAAASPVNATDAADTLTQLRAALAAAPRCLGPQITAAIQALEGRLAQSSIPAVRDQIRAAMTACNYVGALAIALQLQASAPSDEWLAANLGRLRAIEAEQSNALALIRAAQSGRPDVDANTLAPQLRQALATAPSCMANQIRAALAGLEGVNARPGFLDGESAPATQTSASDNLEQARDSLVRTAQDEAEREEAVRRAAELRQREQAEQERNQRALAEQRRQEQTEAEQRRKAEQDTQRRRERNQRIQRTLTGILGNLPAVVGGGAPPAPPPEGGGSSSGGTAAGDIFSGTWTGYGVVTSHREGSDPDKRAVVDARTDARENDIAFRLMKSGAGYVLEGFDGLRATSSYVRGNRIGASGRVQAPDGRWATFKVDYEVNGNQLTGTSRGEGEDGSLIVLSVTCTRQ
jgi:hypothetical protein